MLKNKKYIEIPIRDLPLGKSSFEFTLDDEFFKAMSSDILGGEIYFDMDVERLSTYIHVDWSLEGDLKVICDRCLDEATLDDIKSEGDFTIKLDKQHESEEDEENEVMHVYSSDNYLDLDSYCYDSVYLALPIQRVHSNDSVENSCNPEMLKFIRQEED